MRSSDVYEGAAAPSRLWVKRLGVDRIEAGRAVGAILSDIHLILKPGATAAITGPSGAGKTTLLHAVAGLVQANRGGVLWGNCDIAALPERQRDRWRRNTAGLVFQDFQLFPELGVLDNILLPVRFDRLRAAAALYERARMLAERVGVDGATARTGALSRGEQQRVAVARALIRRPALLLADEPTASLDAENGTRVADLLFEMATEAQATVLIVSHDPALLARVGTIYRLEAGRLAATSGRTV
jgi:putative ABC transport system ATP-binding protein